MKIKVNYENDTITLKRLTPAQYQLLVTLVSHVRLGGEDEMADAAFGFLSDIEAQSDMLEPLYLPDVEVTATTDDDSEYVSVLINSPVLELYCNY